METGMYIRLHAQPLTVSEHSTYDLSVPLKETEEKRTSAVKIILRAGRDEKIRVKDVVGALCSVLPFEEIGPVEIQDRYTSIVIMHDEADLMEKLSGLPVKGKKRTFEYARHH